MNTLLDRLGLAGFDGNQLLIMAMIFAAVFLTVLAVPLLMTSRGSLRRRMGADSTSSAALGAGNGESVRFLDDIGNIGGLLQPITKRLVPTDLATVSAIRRRLIQAGYSRPSAVGWYYCIRTLLAVALPSLFLVVVPLVSGDIGIWGLFALGILLVVVGSYLPSYWVDMRTRSLQRQYLEAFPDALDLLVVCVEAGLSLDNAIARVSDELGGAHRALGQAFKLMSLELRAGKSRQDALRNLADRTGLDDVRAMVTLLLQSEELGTSVAEALRVYSEEMRVRRMLRAETKAMALPVKLAIPLGLFVFPVMMIVIMLPVVIRIKNELLPVSPG